MVNSENQQSIDNDQACSDLGLDKNEVLACNNNIFERSEKKIPKGDSTSPTRNVVNLSSDLLDPTGSRSGSSKIGLKSTFNKNSSPKQIRVLPQNIRPSMKFQTVGYFNPIVEFHKWKNH